MVNERLLIKSLGLLGALLVMLLALLPPIVMARSWAKPVAASGDPLPRLQCPVGYTATIYAEGLSGPDGLAFSPGGILYVAEETAGRVSRIEADGSVTPVLTGLNNPEGVAFDNAGNLYVVEDVPANSSDPTWGRLIKMTPAGVTFTLATNLAAPEGVVWTTDGTIYLTESELQFASNPFNAKTYLTAITPPAGPTRLLTATVPDSYAGITAGPDGWLYVSNETSGASPPRPPQSVFAISPTTSVVISFTTGLTSPEGLRFSPGGVFPLYAAEEDIGGGQGRLSRILPHGSHAPFCTGFYGIEDVIVDATGRFYVSEDSTGLVIRIAPQTPQAVILFIGDGMGEAQRTAARWSAVGQNGLLVMNDLPIIGWSRTASADNPVTDSAAGGTAIATGVKTNNGVIGQAPDGHILTTILERAQAKGMAVGLISTVQMAHATPASFAAHVPDRNMMTEIARQMVTIQVNVLLAGGEDEFLPTSVNGCYSQPGERNDGRNLIGEAMAGGYTYVCTATTLADVNPISTTHLLGLFADEEMPRPFSPTLAAMTQKAINILSQDPDGFFLMVEGGQIDYAAHANDAANAISDTLGLDQAIAIAKTYAALTPTLLIVTADHETGGMSVNLTSSGSPSEDGPFFMPDATPFYVNWTTTGHTAANVPVTAQGPWSEMLAATYENTHLYEVMRLAVDARTVVITNPIYLPIVVKKS